MSDLVGNPKDRFSHNMSAHKKSKGDMTKTIVQLLLYNQNSSLKLQKKCAHQYSAKTVSRDATYDDFSGQFFRIFQIIIFCFVVSICDLVHDVETIFHLSYLLPASGNLF